MKKYIIALVLVIVAGVGSYSCYILWKAFTTPAQVACTAEAKICPDGSAVGRQGPGCEFAPCPTSVVSAEPVAQVVDEMADWKTYRNEKFGFEIKYPADWQVLLTFSDLPERIAFGQIRNTHLNGYDGEHFVFVYDKSSSNIEGLIKDMGKQFSDRQEQKEKITIDGNNALKVRVTSPSNYGWVYEAVIVEKGDYIYFISNGAVQKDSFDKFYNSFKFTK